MIGAFMRSLIMVLVCGTGIALLGGWGQGLPLPAKAALSGLIGATVSRQLARFEGMGSGHIATHLRHSWLLYAFAMLGWVAQGEGLTAPWGKTILVLSIAAAMGDLVTVSLWSRRATRGT